MNKSAFKRKRVDVPCPAPEDASSFYKRLGLDILAPSSTSGQSEEAGPPKKRSVQQASHTVPLATTQRPDKVGQQWTTPTQRPDKVGQQWTTPTQRPDKVGQQWYQSQQRERQAPHHFKQNYPHENRYNGKTASVNVAATYRPQHVLVHRPHGQQTHYRTGVVNNGNTYQPQHVQPTRPIGYQSQTRTSFGNGNIPQQQRVHPTHPHTRTESMSTVASHKPQHAQQPQQRVVRKEPQVKPINRYAPPDYMILMYHPTPTLEDLGLTSYLDSPPSSPRARSPAREAKKADSLPAQDLRSASPARESPRRVLPAWDAPRSASPARESPRRVLPAWDAPRSASPARESITSVSAESKLTNSVAQEMRQTASTARQPMPAMTEAKERNSKRAPTPNEINQHLSKNVKPQSYVPSFAPKGWVPPADEYSQGHTCTSGVTHISKEGNQRSGSNLSNAVPNSMLTSQTEHTSLKTSDSAVGSSLAARPKKSACDWSMIAEQYSSESRQSDDMEAKRDTAYRRYINKGRPFGVEQMPDTGRHQNQMQDAWRHLNRSQTQPFSNQTFNQTNASGNIKDLFGGMSPYSCWIQSTPEDRRCS